MLKNLSVTVAFISLLLTLSLHAQWVTQYSGTEKDLWAIQVFKNGTGYCVGQNGFVAKLTGFGTTWTDIPTPSRPDFYYDLCFLTPDSGWIVGTMSTIYITETGGASWIPPEKPIPFTNAVLRACARFEKDSLDFAWVGGDNSVLYRTEDKGKVWHNANIGIAGTVRDIKFLNNRRGYCATTRGIFMTESGGSSWEKKSGGAIIALSFTSHDSGWAAGWFGTILYSSTPADSGAWRNVYPPEYPTKNLYGISAISDQEAYAVGDGGLVLHSSNSGANWNAVQLRMEGETRNLRDVFALSGDHIWIVGEQGANYYSLGEVSFFDSLPHDTTLIAGDALNIKFSAPFNSRIKIDFQSIDGAEWKTIVKDYPSNFRLYSWTVDSVDSPLARLRIASAVPGKEALSDTMTFKICINDTVSPQISRPNLPFQPLQGRDLTINAIIKDFHDVSTILWYRRGGTTEYDSIMMKNNPMNAILFEATIGNSDVTTHGIEYYIEATDLSCRSNKSFYPDSSKPTPDYIEIFTDNESFSVSPSTPGPNEIYQMISIPLFLDKKAISQVLEVKGVLGPYDQSKWRLFRWNPRANQGKGEYQEYKESLTEITFEPGRAFWLALADLDTLNTGRGHSVAPSDAVIPLIGKGWHQVANPFSYEVFVTNSLLDALQIGNFNEWNPDTRNYAKRNILEPYRGYFIYSNVDSVKLAIPSVETTTLGKIVEESQNSPDWEITLSVHSINISGSTLIFGQSSNASDQFDRLDWLDPPPPSIQMLKSYIPHPDWPSFKGNYRADIRSLKDEGDFWDFDIEANIEGLIKLTFDLDPRIPAEAQVILLPNDTNLPYNLRERSYFQYLNSKAGDVKQFRLAVGSEEYVTEQSASLQPTRFVLSQNYPNPFNPTTTIRYALPVPSMVTLKIYNTLGEEVAVLLDNELKGVGYHVQTWNGVNKHGQEVHSGIYFYRLKAGAFSDSKKMLLIK